MAKIVFFGEVYCESKTTLVAWPSKLLGDCAVLNFEYVYDDGSINDADAAPGKVNLKGRGSPFLTGFGTYVATLANNHALDYGQSGCQSTLSLITQNNAKAVGFRNCGPYVMLPGDVSVSSYMHPGLKYSKLDGCDYSVCLIDEKTILEDARKAQDAGSKYHVVTLHWGTELLSKPWPNQIQLAHQLIDSGFVDMIVGMHAHCEQPYEIYKGKYIFYSLGNAVFPNYCQKSNFVDGVPGKLSHGSWGRESATSLVPVLDSANGGVTVYRMMYDGASMYEQTVPTESKDIRITRRDCWRAFFRRECVGVRLILRGHISEGWWNLVLGKKGLRSYLSTMSKMGWEG